MIEEKLGTSSGTTTVTKTLLWEREIPRNDNADEVIKEEREIEVKNLSEYKQLIIEIEDEYLDIEYMKENNENYIAPGTIGHSVGIGIKYINENTLKIVDPSEIKWENITYRIYGIEG